WKISNDKWKIFRLHSLGVSSGAGRFHIDGFFSLDAQAPIEPFQLALEEVDLMIRLLNAVTFARIAKEDDFDAALFERAIILFALRDGDAKVAFAVRNHNRRFHTIDK